MGMNLPDQADAQAIWRERGFAKGQSRLEKQVEAKPLTVVDEKAFKKAIRKRDGKFCRCCQRKVVVQLERAANRAENHHLHGRRGDFRFDDRFALQVCMACHEKLTGRVNEKWRAIGTVFIEIKGQPCIDARAVVTFQRIA